MAIKEQIVGSILEYFDENNYRYKREDTSADITRIGLRYLNSVFDKLYIGMRKNMEIIISPSTVTIYTRYKATSKGKNCLGLLELMAELNNLEILGNLELDIDTGVLRYKSHILFSEGALPDSKLLARYINAGVELFRKNSEAIRDAMAGSVAAG